MGILADFFMSIREVDFVALCARNDTSVNLSIRCNPEKWNAATAIQEVLSGIGFGGVKQLFFPDSSMTKLMVDYWAPEGTRIQQVAADLARAEKHLLADERIDSVVSFIGSGPPR